MNRTQRLQAGILRGQTVLDGVVKPLYHRDLIGRQGLRRVISMRGEIRRWRWVSAAFGSGVKGPVELLMRRLGGLGRKTWREM